MSRSWRHCVRAEPGDGPGRGRPMSVAADRVGGVPETSESTRPRLLLLDGHSLAYRAFFALPVENFATATGPAHQRGLRLHLDAGQRAARRGAHPRGGRLRQVATDLPARAVPRLQGQAQQDARRVRQPAAADPAGARRAATSSTFELDGFEADDIIATLATQALAEGMEVLILTGDRDSIQLVTENSTVLYPMRGVSDLARLTPAASRRSTASRRTATPSSRRSWGRPPTTCPASRVSARATPRSGSTSSTASTTSSPAPTRSPARRARRCAPTSAT